MPVDSLNTPDLVLANIDRAFEIAKKVDSALGRKRFERFAHALSSLFAHMNPKSDGLASWLAKEQSAHLTLFLLSAGTELRTGWHAIRLGNVPCCYRCARVATEDVAVGAMCVVPRQLLARASEPRKSVRLIRESTSSVFHLCNARRDKVTGNIVPPEIRAVDATNLFLNWLEHVVEADSALIEDLRKTRSEIHHPFSHGTTEAWTMHFHGTTGDEAGFAYSKKMIPFYVQCAEDTIGCADSLAAVLQAVNEFLR